MIMKTSPNDVSNQEILKELKKLAASDVSVRNELKKLTASDISIKEELQRLNEKFVTFEEKVDTQFSRIDARFSNIDTKFSSIDTKFSKLEEKIDGVHMETMEAIHDLADQTDKRFIGIEREQIRLRSNMVTKEYLDDKMADLRVDISQNTKRQIEKAML